MKKLLFALLWILPFALHAGTYTIRELPPLATQSGAPTGAYGLSNSGSVLYVAGYSGSGSAMRAVRWEVTTTTVGTPLDLGVLSPYTTSIAYGANDSGSVAGASGKQAFLWRWSAIPQLQAVPAPSSAPSTARCVTAYAINNSDEVVGFYSRSVQGSSVLLPGWAFRWSPWGGTVLYDGFRRTSLGSNAFAINEDSVLAGQGEVTTTGGVIAATQAYLWNPRVLIGSFPDPDGGSGFSTAYGINNGQEVVGISEGLAFYWNSLSGLISLGVEGTARDINNIGDIVGYTGQYAFVKPLGGMVQDLNSLIPPNSGWTKLNEAYAVNDNSWIVGIGTKSNGTRRGFVLVPVP